jgi:hypothetical protein
MTSPFQIIAALYESSKRSFRPTSSCRGMEMSWSSCSLIVRKSKILVTQVLASSVGSKASTTTCGKW